MPNTIASESVIDNIFSFKEVGKEKFFIENSTSFFIIEKEVYSFLSNVIFVIINKIIKEVKYKHNINLLKYGKERYPFNVAKMKEKDGIVNERSKE